MKEAPCSHSHFPHLSSPSPARSSWWLGQSSPAQRSAGLPCPAPPLLILFSRLLCFVLAWMPYITELECHLKELCRRWDFRAIRIRQQSVHTATRFHARVIRMYNAASAITHSPGSMRRFCDLVRRRVPPLSYFFFKLHGNVDVHSTYAHSFL